MTLTEAYARLKAHWPGHSFKIGVEVWNHTHLPNGLEVEWSVYDAPEHQHYVGATLDHVMEQVLGITPDLASVERTIEKFPDDSGYLIHGPLTQVQP